MTNPATAPARVLAPRSIHGSRGQGNQGRVEAPKPYDWASFVKLAATPTPAAIPHTEFMALPKNSRGALKQIDPFILFGACEDGRRTDEHLQYRSVATLDYDAADAAGLLAALRADFIDVPFAYVWHTTRSHCADAVHLRVLVPLARDIQPEEYRPLAEVIAREFRATLDPASLKAAQMMYLPMRNQGAPFEAGAFEGQGYLNPDAYLADVAIEVTQGKNSRAIAKRANDFNPLETAEPPIGVTLDQAREYLAKLSADIPEPEWLAILHSIHHEFGNGPHADEAREMAREWSATAGDRFDDDAFESRYDRAQTSPRSKPRTFRSIIKAAADADAQARDSAIEKWCEQIAKATLRDELQDKIPKAIARDSVLSSFARDELAEVLQARNKEVLDVTLNRAKLRRLMDAPERESHAPRARFDDLTEFGNTARMFELLGSALMHTPEDGAWYRWVGHHWKRTPEAAIRGHAKRVIDTLHLSAAELEGAAQRDALQWALMSKKASMINSMVSILSAEVKLQVSVDELDSQPHLLGVANGAVDLTTGELHKSDRRDRLTVATAIPYNAEATCPLFEQTVSDAFFDDAELVAFFQRVIGYALMGNPKEDVIIIPFGGGNNGKSTILNAVMDVLGAHAKGTPAGTFMDIKGASNGGASEALLRLRGSRFVYMQEPEEGAVLREGLVKSITGGDVVTARGVYAKHSIEFRPTWVTFMPTNHKPIIRNDDEGIWRRLLLIPFTRNFSADATVVKDIDRAEKLKAEYEGILAWCVAGALAYQREGLRNEPRVVKAARASYKADMDPLREWMDDELVAEPAGRITSAQLWSSWAEYARKNGGLELCKSARMLTQRLRDRGFESFRSMKQRGFIGLALKGVSAESQGFDANDASDASAETSAGDSPRVLN